MSFYLVVEAGDHLAGIADENGFADWRTIWNCPENDELRQARDPNVLKPGDRVFIPDKQPKTVGVATGERHRFVRAGTSMVLALRLCDLVGAPLKNAAVNVTLPGRSLDLTTDGDGAVTVPIRPDDDRARVEVGAFSYELRIGHLDPVDDRAGLAARLRNLGYLIDARDENDSLGRPTDEALAFAVELFQNDHRLPVDGRDLESVRAKLKEIHGC